MKFLRGLIKVAIALFVVWHIAATFIYSLYHVENVPPLQWLTTQRRHVRPYILITSQWQRWNLFSPDPLRRVIEKEIDRKAPNGTWVKIYTLNKHNVSWWQRAPELKIMRRMEDKKMQPLQERYVHDYCSTHYIPVGTSMRMRKRWFVIPRHETTQTKEWWNAWEPEWQEIELLQTTCPTTS